MTSGALHTLDSCNKCVRVRTSFSKNSWAPHTKKHNRILVNSSKNAMSFCSQCVFLRETFLSASIGQLLVGHKLDSRINLLLWIAKMFLKPFPSCEIIRYLWRTWLLFVINAHIYFLASEMIYVPLIYYFITTVLKKKRTYPEQKGLKIA